MRSYYTLICLFGVLCGGGGGGVSGTYRVIKELLSLPDNSVAERHSNNRFNM